MKRWGSEMKWHPIEGGALLCEQCDEIMYGPDVWSCDCEDLDPIYGEPLEDEIPERWSEIRTYPGYMPCDEKKDETDANGLEEIWRADKRAYLFKAQIRRYEQARQLGCNKETLYYIGRLAALERQEFEKGPKYWPAISILWDPLDY